MNEGNLMVFETTAFGAPELYSGRFWSMIIMVGQGQVWIHSGWLTGNVVTR